MLIRLYTLLIVIPHPTMYQSVLYSITVHIIYTDINECAGVNECQQHCHNTIGSYNCSCDVGFTLNSDGRNSRRGIPGWDIVV